MTTPDLTLEEAGAILISASKAGSATDVLALLKEHSAPVWFQDGLGWSALHYAAERGDADLVKVLLDNGAVWNAGQHRRMFAASRLGGLMPDAATSHRQSIFTDMVQETSLCR